MKQIAVIFVGWLVLVVVLAFAMAWLEIKLECKKAEREEAYRERLKWLATEWPKPENELMPRENQKGGCR